jgi:hypothetical protein
MVEWFQLPTTNRINESYHTNIAFLGNLWNYNDEENQVDHMLTLQGMANLSKICAKGDINLKRLFLKIYYTI